MKRKARRWWIIGGAGMLLAAAAGVALVFPAKPYDFLKDASLQNIDVHDIGPLGSFPGSATAPSSKFFTTRSYASDVDFDELYAKASDELLHQGFRENRPPTPPQKPLDFVSFDKGTEAVDLHRIPAEYLDMFVMSPVWASLTGKAKTYIEVTTHTTPLDRLQDKLHRDKLPGSP